METEMRGNAVLDEPISFNEGVAIVNVYTFKKDVAATFRTTCHKEIAPQQGAHSFGECHCDLLGVNGQGLLRTEIPGSGFLD